jgi:hypothetical protein
MSVMIILNERFWLPQTALRRSVMLGGPTILIKKGDKHVSTDSIERLRIIQRNKKKSLLMEVVEITGVLTPLVRRVSFGLVPLIS